jgi:hypothetical protein
VKLSPSRYDVEWFGVTDRQTVKAPAIAADGDERFSPPRTGQPYVLYLKRTG